MSPLPQRIGQKFRILKTIPQIQLVGDGKPLLKYNLGPIFRVEEGSLIVNLGRQPFSFAKDLVGIPGAAWTPSLVSVRTTREAREGLRWAQRSLGPSFKNVTQLVSANFVLKALIGNGLDLSPVILPSLGNNLWALRDSAGSEEKTKEIRKRLKGIDNSKKKANSKLQGFSGSIQHIERLVDHNSELIFARLADRVGSLQFASTPDMYIDNIGVEVKKLAPNPNDALSDLWTRINRRAADAFSQQQAQIVAIDVGSTVLGVWLRSPGGARIGVRNFRSVLKQAIVQAKRGKKVILAFVYDPWTMRAAACIC